MLFYVFIYVIFCYPGTCNSKGPAPTIFFILGVLNTWIRHGDLPKYHIFFVQISLFLEVGNRMFNSKLKKKILKFFRNFCAPPRWLRRLTMIPYWIKECYSKFWRNFFFGKFFGSFARRRVITEACAMISDWFLGSQR